MTTGAPTNGGPSRERTLARRRHPLADPATQRAVLDALPLPARFAESIADAGLPALRADGIAVLQVNVGKYCNQTCRHCHVDAGPDRQETMSAEVVQACLSVLAQSAIQTLDITGGAPELHPQFRLIVEQGVALERHVIDRANLTALLLPSQADLPEFLAAQGVEIIASLPYYLPTQTDAQRGAGVFDLSIAALRRLNAVGYGMEGSGLTLTLIVNPVGSYLPASQQTLERDWHRELAHRYDVQFSRLYTITNMPIGRFLAYLQESGNLENYVHLLASAFNPATVPQLMCRTTLSVSWDGRLYDCDFNQMLEIPCDGAAPQTIWEFEEGRAAQRRIVGGPHCYGCTAGAGSSCGGAIV